MKGNREQNMRALSSTDGIEWKQSGYPQSSAWPPETDDSTVKLVVGELRADGANGSWDEVIEMLKNINAKFPNLTHLYVWGLEVTDIGGFPDGLKVLDVRFCKKIRELPVLPESLEDLDLAYCDSLSDIAIYGLPNLLRLYIDNSQKIPADRLNIFLQDCPQLEEFSATNCIQIRSLELQNRSHGSLEEDEGGYRKFSGRKLKRLVLEGCESLQELPDLSEFPWLYHVNLKGCVNLKTLRDIPDALQYLELSGADRLTRFLGQGIGAYDRGKEGGNVADRFKSRKKFGVELSLAAHAKLLLLGDGRVGKSTLAKCLQWHELRESPRWEVASIEQRKEWENTLKPRTDESPTHKMNVWEWETSLRLDDSRMVELQEEAKSAELEWPEAEKGDLQGRVGIWDFGGQEIYHNTHRVFAGRGAVFLLCWDPEKIASDSYDEECPPGYPTELWRELNTRRPLDYWLEYIYSMNSGAQVALVSPQGRSSDGGWRDEFPRHAEKNLSFFSFDSCSENCPESPGYRGLIAWLRRALGEEADKSVGIIQPRFFKESAITVGQMLEKNSRSRETGENPKYLLLNWHEWVQTLKTQHRNKGLGGRLDESDVDAITRYLDDAGQLTPLQHREEKGVLIDQSWGTSLIYEILRPAGEIHQSIIRNGGWFAKAELESHSMWKSLESDLQRGHLLRFMEGSGILVPFVSNARGPVLYMANEKWLLPPEDKLNQQMRKRLNLVAQFPDAEFVEAFSFENEVSEFEFRRLMAFLGGEVAASLGTNALWFQRGMQVMPDGVSPGWCFRIRWEETPGEFFGRVDAQLHARRELVGTVKKEIEFLFNREDCPLSQNSLIPRADYQGDLSSNYFCPRRTGKGVIGISSRGVDEITARQLVCALRSSHIGDVLWYLDSECREGTYKKVYPYMESLVQSDVMLFFLSDHYLEDDPETNWYCLWELANVINQLADGTRHASKILVIYRSGDDVSSKNLDTKVSSLLRNFGRHFSEKYSKKDWEEQDSFKYYEEISTVFRKAYQEGRVGKFFAEKGTLGAYDRIPEANGVKDFSSLVESVKNALER